MTLAKVRPPNQRHARLQTEDMYHDTDAWTALAETLIADSPCCIEASGDTPLVGAVRSPCSS